MNYTWTEIVHQIRQLTQQWERDLCDVNNVDELANALARASERATTLRTLVEELQERLAGIMKEPWVETTAGVLRRERKGPTYKWDHEEAFRHVVAAAKAYRPDLVDPQTGEMPEESDVVAEALRAAIGPSYWRVSALARMGLDADEFRSITRPATNTVRIVT